MSFDSPVFLVLLVVSMALVRLPAGGAGRALLAASAVFYAFAGLGDWLLFAALIVVNWTASLWVERYRWVLPLTLALDVAVLGIFKYREMLLPHVLTGGFARVAIPLGISFYLFHIMSYLVDLRAGRFARVGLGKFALFVAFFPHLIAGPIVRAGQLMPQLERLWKGRSVRHHLAVFGLALCLLGLVKKIVFANSLAPVVDDLFVAVPTNTGVAWAGAWLFGFQIYFDFSGYSDLALGSAMLLGIRLPINFRTPYLAVGPREFWQRWHISLSTWIRDYLYIPLGGSRAGSFVHQAVILLGVMALAGLWHGANWTFVVWGALWGLYILLWRLGAPMLAHIPRVVLWGANMVVVMVLWVFFRAPDIDFALRYVAVMFTSGATGTPFDQPAIMVVAGLAVLTGLHWLESRTQNGRFLLALRRVEHPVWLSTMAGLCILLMLLPTYDINPFIYFRF